MPRRTTSSATPTPARGCELTETATEVVETDPATFTFRVVRASQSATTSRPCGRTGGRAPFTSFVNGTPERTTGSREEDFQVTGPHFNPADGAPTMRYWIDDGPVHTMPASRVFSTGTLGLGEHSVTVTTSNHAGTTARLVPLAGDAAAGPGRL